MACCYECRCGDRSDLFDVFNRLVVEGKRFMIYQSHKTAQVKIVISIKFHVSVGSREDVCHSDRN